MTSALLIALLIQMGVCAQNEFHSPDGATLTVVVCPMMAPKTDEPEEKPDPRKHT